MARIEILRLKSSGSQEVVAEFRLVGDKAVGEGDEKLIERLRQAGILDRSTDPPEKVFPEDGERFLECLKDRFKSGYLVAMELP